MSDIHIWVGKELKEAAKKLNINLSKEFREFLEQRLKEHNIEVPKEEPRIIIAVRCIHCGNTFETSSIGQVRCPRCQKTFRVYTRRYGSRIVKIVKGTREELFKLYAKKFRRGLY